MSGVLDAASYEGYPELLPLVQSVNDHPEALATGDYGIRDSALQAEKFIFDQSASFLLYHHENDCGLNLLSL